MVTRGTNLVTITQLKASDFDYTSSGNLNFLARGLELPTDSCFFSFRAYLLPFIGSILLEPFEAINRIVRRGRHTRKSVGIRSLEEG